MSRFEGSGAEQQSQYQQIRSVIGDASASALVVKRRAIALISAAASD
jgi:hypothetical protein